MVFQNVFGVNKKKRFFKYFICCLLLVFILLTIYNKHQTCNAKGSSSKSPTNISFYCWLLTAETSSLQQQQTTKKTGEFSGIVSNTKKSLHPVEENVENREQQESLETTKQKTKRPPRGQQSPSNDVSKPTSGSIDSLLITEGISSANTKGTVQGDIKVKTNSPLGSKQDQHITSLPTIINKGDGQAIIKSYTINTSQTQPDKSTITTTTTTTTPAKTTTRPTTTTTTSTITTTTTTPAKTTTRPTTTTTTPTTPTTAKPTEKSTNISTKLSPNIPPTAMEPNLKCHIPKLDPFHREVTPYIRWNWLNETCKIKQTQSRVENGKLFVYIGEINAQKGKVDEVRLHYIKRVNDYQNTVTNQLIYRRNNETLDDEKGKIYLLPCDKNKRFLLIYSLGAAPT